MPGVKRTASAAGLPDAPPPPPPQPHPPPYGLGELDLVGLLTHPHLGAAVFEYFGDDTVAATALRGTWPRGWCGRVGGARRSPPQRRPT